MIYKSEFWRNICLTSKLIFLLICDDLIVILSNHGFILLPCVFNRLRYSHTSKLMFDYLFPFPAIWMPHLRDSFGGRFQSFTLSLLTLLLSLLSLNLLRFLCSLIIREYFMKVNINPCYLFATIDSFTASACHASMQ